MGISKTKSEMKTYDESSIKASIKGKDININSKESSVILVGTDITAKNLTLNAKEDIQINATDEKHTSSNKSSSSGISLSASLNETPLSLTLSTSGMKGKANGTNFVNSIINIEENLKISANKIEVNNLQNIYKFYS